jgi:hypothetical protein
MNTSKQFPNDNIKIEFKPFLVFFCNGNLSRGISISGSQPNEKSISFSITSKHYKSVIKNTFKLKKSEFCSKKTKVAINETELQIK